MTVRVLLVEIAKAVLAGSAESLGELCPPLQAAANGALWLIERLQDMGDLEEDRKHLQTLVFEFAEIIFEVIPPSKIERNHQAEGDIQGPRSSATKRLRSSPVLQLLKDIQEILSELRECVEQRRNGSRLCGFVLRIAMVDKDRAKLLQLEKQLSHALLKFQVKAHINHHETLQDYAKYMKQLLQHSHGVSGSLKDLGRLVGELALGYKLPAREFARKFQAPLKQYPFSKRFEVIMGQLQDMRDKDVSKTGALTVNDKILEDVGPNATTDLKIATSVIDPEFEARLSGAASEIRVLVEQILRYVQNGETQRTVENELRRGQLAELTSALDGMYRHRDSVDKLQANVKDLHQYFERVHMAHHEWETLLLEELGRLPENIVQQLILQMGQWQSRIQKLARVEDALCEAERHPSITSLRA